MSTEAWDLPRGCGPLFIYTMVDEDPPAPYPWPLGYVVESSTGEVQAWRKTFAEAEASVVDVDRYWHEAEMCGHPAARLFVARLRPWTVRPVFSQAELEELHERPPVIDREG